MNNKCFALRRGKYCCALSVKNCSGCEKCEFRKRPWEHERDLEAANIRLCSLPEEMQMRIAQKYYGGKMPWRGACV